MKMYRCIVVSHCLWRSGFESLHSLSGSHSLYLRQEYILPWALREKHSEFATRFAYEKIYLCNYWMRKLSCISIFKCICHVMFDTSSLLSSQGLSVQLCMRWLHISMNSLVFILRFPGEPMNIGKYTIILILNPSKRTFSWDLRYSPNCAILAIREMSLTMTMRDWVRLALKLSRALFVLI